MPTTFGMPPPTIGSGEHSGKPLKTKDTITNPRILLLVVGTEDIFSGTIFSCYGLCIFSFRDVYMNVQMGIVHLEVMGDGIIKKFITVGREQFIYCLGKASRCNNKRHNFFTRDTLQE